MTPPRILLYGIYGVYNYGCEAIVRGTVRLLREEWPEARIQYASPRWEDDARRLAGCDVEVVPRVESPRYSLRNLARKSTDILGFRWWPVSKNDQRLAANNDVLLSIGGDIYTPGPSGRSWPRELVSFGNYMKHLGKQTVIWGASVGPFPVGTKASRVMVKHLQNIDLITSREPSSTEYLRALGLKTTVVACSDPAFAVRCCQTPEPQAGSRRRIGINLSPLSARCLQDKQLEQTAADQAEAISSLSRIMDADVVLVPHVHSPFYPADDDLGYLQQVHAAIPQSMKEKIWVHKDDCGFLGAKAVLKTCDLVIAARMHCAINSISEAVPTVLLSYSEKSIGMGRHVYGNDDWVIPLAQFNSPRTFEIIRSRLQNKCKIVRYLKTRVPEILKNTRAGMTSLRGICGLQQFDVTHFLE